MKNFIVTIRLNQPDGHTTHTMRAQGPSMEEVMVRFGMASEHNEFMAVKCYRVSGVLQGERTEYEYGVVFPLTSVREVIYQEV